LINDEVARFSPEFFEALSNLRAMIVALSDGENAEQVDDIAEHIGEGEVPSEDTVPSHLLAAAAVIAAARGAGSAFPMFLGAQSDMFVHIADNYGASAEGFVSYMSGIWDDIGRIAPASVDAVSSRIVTDEDAASFFRRPEDVLKEGDDLKHTVFLSDGEPGSYVAAAMIPVFSSASMLRDITTALSASYPLVAVEGNARKSFIQAQIDALKAVTNLISEMRRI
jgi:hypothetical protein